MPTQHPPADDPVFAAAARQREYDVRLATDHKELNQLCQPLQDAADYTAATEAEFIPGWASTLITATRALDEAGLGDLRADEPGETWVPRRLARAALRSAKRGQVEAERAARLIFADEAHRGGVRTALGEIATQAKQYLRQRQVVALRRDYPDLVSPAEPDDQRAGEAKYDPCDREPRTFAELVSWLAYAAYFADPRRSGIRPPTVARNPGHHYLECYCKETFGGWGLDAFGRLRDRYLVQTGKTVDEVGETTLRELADHFRRLSGAPGGAKKGDRGTPPTDADRKASEELGDAGELITLGREVWSAVADHVSGIRGCDTQALNDRMPEAARRAMRVVPFGTPGFEEWERRVTAVRSACAALLRCPTGGERTALLDSLCNALASLENAAVANGAATRGASQARAGSSENVSAGSGVTEGPPPNPAARNGPEGNEGERLNQNDKPDGPFGTDGFRFGGVEVRFGRAALRYRLVLALWDAATEQLAAPRSVEDVMAEVWGEEHETVDSAFRQLCSDTRRRFQAANCPLDIHSMSGRIQLTRL